MRLFRDLFGKKKDTVKIIENVNNNLDSFNLFRKINGNLVIILTFQQSYKKFI